MHGFVVDNICECNCLTCKALTEINQAPSTARVGGAKDYDMQFTLSLLYSRSTKKTSDNTDVFWICFYDSEFKCQQMSHFGKIMFFFSFVTKVWDEYVMLRMTKLFCMFNIWIWVIVSFVHALFISNIQTTVWFSNWLLKENITIYEKSVYIA